MSLSPVTMTTSKPACSAWCAKRADQIVRLVAGLPDGRNVEGIHHAMDVGNLGAHAFRHRRPLRLVCLELRVAQRRTLSRQTPRRDHPASAHEESSATSS